MSNTLNDQRIATYQAALRAYGRLRAAKRGNAPRSEIERLTAEAQETEALWRATHAKYVAYLATSAS